MSVLTGAARSAPAAAPAGAIPSMHGGPSLSARLASAEARAQLAAAEARAAGAERALLEQQLEAERAASASAATAPAPLGLHLSTLSAQLAAAEARAAGAEHALAQNNASSSAEHAAFAAGVDAAARSAAPAAPAAPVAPSVQRIVDVGTTGLIISNIRAYSQRIMDRRRAEAGVVAEELVPDTDAMKAFYLASILIFSPLAVFVKTGDLCEALVNLGFACCPGANCCHAGLVVYEGECLLSCLPHCAMLVPPGQRINKELARRAATAAAEAEAQSGAPAGPAAAASAVAAAAAEEMASAP